MNGNVICMLKIHLFYTRYDNIYKIYYIIVAYLKGLKRDLIYKEKINY